MSLYIRKADSQPNNIWLFESFGEMKRKEYVQQGTKMAILDYCAASGWCLAVRG